MKRSSSVSSPIGVGRDELEIVGDAIVASIEDGVSVLSKQGTAISSLSEAEHSIEGLMSSSWEVSSAAVHPTDAINWGGDRNITSLLQDGRNGLTG